MSVRVQRRRQPRWALPGRSIPSRWRGGIGETTTRGDPLCPPRAVELFASLMETRERRQKELSSARRRETASSKQVRQLMKRIEEQTQELTILQHVRGADPPKSSVRHRRPPNCSESFRDPQKQPRSRPPTGTAPEQTLETAAQIENLDSQWEVRLRSFESGQVAHSA